MIISLYMKHDDRAVISTDDVETEGYLPRVNNVLGGDDTHLKIDNETGRIIGWTPIKVINDEFVTV